MIQAALYSSGRPVNITVDGEKIASVEEGGAGGAQTLTVAPAFVDLQVNGFGGLDFKACGGKIDEIRRAIRHLWSTGTAYCLPTLITGAREGIRDSLAALEQVRTGSPEGASILGYHLEGPYISPDDGYRGAHARSFCREPDRDEFQEWWEASGRRIRLVTLAPEVSGAVDFIGHLRRLGVRAAIGHSRAGAGEVAAAVRAGATLSTHLGNGIPRVLPRHPNVVWEQLAAGELWADFIADGEHLDNAVIRSFLKIKGDRAFLVSDASRWAGAAAGDYVFEGRPIRVEADGGVHFADDGGLLGSGRYLHQCVSHAVRSGLADEKTAVEMASVRPARYLGMEGRRGSLEPGTEAACVVYRWDKNRQMEVVETWIKGKMVYKNS